MSEVYIRSQNKEKLYRLGGNYACVEYGEYEDIKKKRGGAEADKKRHVICISDGCLEEIGEYATKERCLEVLDEIQKACVSYLFTAGGAAVIRGGMDVQPLGGGIKGNAAGLVGTLTQIKEIKQLCGLPFCGYMAKLETVRPSGVPDEVTVVFAEDVPYRACNGIEFDVMQEFVEGSRLLLTGKVQTLKDFQSGRLLVYILADFVAVSEKAVEQDEAVVRGVIANKPTYRETPRGKRITDITVKVRNELTGGSCFLPCICWQEQADEAAQWQQGDTVELLGRYQSRQYEKVLDAATGEREQRTAYEVSVRLIRRKEEAENEC